MLTLNEIITFEHEIEHDLEHDLAHKKRFFCSKNLFGQRRFIKTLVCLLFL